MKIMAIDYGDARTGVALCDIGEMLASPTTVIHEHNKDRLVKKILLLATEKQVELLVIGHPINMNGTLGPRSELASALAQKLRDQLPIDVVLWDERSTTVSAINILNATDVRGKKRKAVVDAVAAVIILENYMSFRKNQRKED